MIYQIVITMFMVYRLVINSLLLTLFHTVIYSGFQVLLCLYLLLYSLDTYVCCDILFSLIVQNQIWWKFILKYNIECYYIAYDAIEVWKNSIHSDYVTIDIVLELKITAAKILFRR